jgi:3-mercaptopyruvate sulfurtransferase SseA
MTESLGVRDVRIFGGAWIAWGNVVGAPIEK